jgi:polyhydroxyalkanoate synthesis regulator phasin
MTTIKKGVLIGAAGLLAAGVGGVAVAATSGDGAKTEQAIIDDAAGKLNVSPSALRDALKTAVQDQLDQSVKDGKLTQAQADAIKQRMDASGRILPFGGPGRFGPGGPEGRGEHGLLGARGALLSAAAGYLDLKEADLRGQLAAGKSLATIAGDKGKSVDGLKTALRDAVKTDLDAAVKRGDITQAQEDERLKEVDAHLDELVNGTVQRGRRFGPRRGPGPGGPPVFGFHR